MLRFVLRHILIKVGCRREEKIIGFIDIRRFVFIHTLSSNGGVEHNWGSKAYNCTCLAKLFWKPIGWGFIYQFLEIRDRELGEDLSLAIVMMNPIREPYTFEINKESFPIRPHSFTRISFVNSLENMTNSEVMLVILIPQDIAPTKCRLT